jgi:LuxR family transcriptional regulator, activator of conjugal transfer of Ti plasmids
LRGPLDMQPRLQFILADFLGSLRNAKDEAALQSAATRMAASIGYKWFAYFSRKPQDEKIVSSYPKSWLLRYEKQQYAKVDKVLSVAQRRGECFLWSGTDLANEQAQRQLFGEASEFGIAHGVTIPIVGNLGKFAALTFSGPDSNRLLGISGEQKDLFNMTAAYFHAHFEMKVPGANPPASISKLTMREKQCLMWIANGKTIGDAAGILGITRRTVVHHVSNAKSKLGAATLVQTVALALKSGEIDL